MATGGPRINDDEHYILHKGNQLLIFQKIGVRSGWVDQILMVTTSENTDGKTYTSHDNIMLHQGPHEAREIWNDKVNDGWERVK